MFGCFFGCTGKWDKPFEERWVKYETYYGRRTGQTRTFVKVLQSRTCTKCGTSDRKCVRSYYTA